jgi:hypothetical protein
MKGKPYFNDEAAKIQNNSIKSNNKVRHREREVLELIEEVLTTNEIYQINFMRMATVGIQGKDLLSKFDPKYTAFLIHFATRQKITISCW